MINFLQDNRILFSKTLEKELLESPDLIRSLLSCFDWKPIQYADQSTDGKATFQAELVRKIQLRVPDNRRKKWGIYFY